MPPDRCQIDSDCRQLTDLASSLASQGQYEEALATFQRAYERVPEPRLLVNLGRCHFRLGRPQKALGLYRALQNAMPDLPPELDAKVKQFIAEAEDVISKDAGLAGPAQGLPLSGGNSGSKPPEKPPESLPTPRPDTTAALAGGRGPGAEPAAPPTTQVAAVSAAEGRRPTWRIAVGATGLALGAGAIGIGAWALSVDGQCITESTQFPGRCLTTTATDGQMTAQVRDGRPAGIGFLVTGGALLVAGAVLIALPGKRPASPAALRLRPDQGRLALGQP